MNQNINYISKLERHVKGREDVIFCRFKAENIASIFEEKNPVSTRLLRLL